MKHKVLVVPFMTDTNGRVRFVVVKERRFNEWSFVCGNCKKNEISNPVKAALRELREETLDTLVISSPFKYMFKYSPTVVKRTDIGEEGEDVLFHVFLFNIQGIKPPGVIKNYYTRRKQNYKSSNRDYTETMGIAFMTITDLSRKKMWPFLVSRFINNQKFWEDIAFLKNENYQRQLQYDKKQEILSSVFAWSTLKCSPGALGRVELVPRARGNPKFPYQQRVQRYVSRSPRFSHFKSYKKSEGDWRRRSFDQDDNATQLSL